MGSFLIDHPGHGGNTHQRRDQNEKHRKYPGDTRDNIGRAVQIVITNVAVPVQNGQIRRIHGVNFIPGIQQLFLGVLQLLFRVSQFFFGILLCLLVVLPAFLQFIPALCPFAPAHRDFLFRVVQLGFIFPHFQLALINSSIAILYGLHAGDCLIHLLQLSACLLVLCLIGL